MAFTFQTFQIWVSNVLYQLRKILILVKLATKCRYYAQLTIICVTNIERKYLSKVGTSSGLISNQIFRMFIIYRPNVFLRMWAWKGDCIANFFLFNDHHMYSVDKCTVHVLPASANQERKKKNKNKKRYARMLTRELWLF